MNIPIAPIIINENVASLSDTNVLTNPSVKLSPTPSLSDITPKYNNAHDIDMVFIKNGFTKIKMMKKTLQGELYKALKISNTDEEPQYVAIKRTSKYLYQKRIAIEDGINFCVSENIIKQTLITKYLTVDNQPIGNYIAQFLHFFSSDTDYFLVMEYIDSEMNLKQFVSKANEYIQAGKLSLINYHRIIKYLLWQLFVTIQYLHDSMNCCHLDIVSANIMLQNATFTEINNKVYIPSKICIKLIDFGVSEVFCAPSDNQINVTTNFVCSKYGLSIHNEGYFSPKIINGDIYDAKAADMWNLGMLLFECLTVGQHLYEPLNMYKRNSGYASLFNGKFIQYLASKQLLKYFAGNSLTLLIGLLNVNEKRRFKSIDVLKHHVFTKYFDRYKNQIIKKSFLQKRRLMDQEYKMKRFPFYK